VLEVAELFRMIASARSPDQFGHVWSIATHVEHVPPDEMAERTKG
jgi:hypothetical protein